VPVFLQRRVPRVTTVLVSLTLGLSLLAVIDARHGGSLWYRLALLPDAVWRGQIWRLVTWPFVMGHPLSLLYTCVALYAFGSDLAVNWGLRRYLRTLAVVVLIAGAGTCLLAPLLPHARELPHLGGMALADALVIAWARQFPDQPVLAYFVLLVRGPALVAVVVTATLVFAAYFGLAWMMPELLAVAAALFLSSRARRRLWLELKLRWVRRKLRALCYARAMFRFSLVSAFVLVAALAACDDKKKSEPAGGPPATDTPPAAADSPATTTTEPALAAADPAKVEEAANSALKVMAVVSSAVRGAKGDCARMGQNLTGVMTVAQKWRDQLAEQTRDPAVKAALEAGLASGRYPELKTNVDDTRSGSAACPDVAPEFEKVLAEIE
jgi:membrane associated rhomboid family serine protease